MKEKTNRDYCFRHASMYEGWQCPLCAKEEEEKAAGGGAAAAGAPVSPEAAAELAAARIQRSPSRIESKAKSDQAEAMLVSGAAREALDLCESAVEIDPRNLHAHIVGARASRILRDAVREREFLEDTVKLLRSDEYARESKWYHEVLKHARDTALVTQLAKTFIAARKWPAADALPLVRALVGRGAVSEALTILDSLPRTDRSLLTCAYSMQLTGTAVGRVDPDLHAYLEGTPAERRAQILAELLEVQASDVIAALTVARVKDAVRTRYEGWSADVKHLISEEARRLGAEKLAPSLAGPAMSWALRFFLGALVFGVVLTLAFGGNALVLVLSGAVALACGGAGYAYGRDVELKKLLPTVLPEIREDLMTRESDRWASVLSDDHGAVEGGEEQPAASETCAYCGASVKGGTKACPQCGRELAQESPEAASVPAPAGASAEASPEEAAPDGGPTLPGHDPWFDGGGTPEA